MKKGIYQISFVNLFLLANPFIIASCFLAEGIAGDIFKIFTLVSIWLLILIFILKNRIKVNLLSFKKRHYLFLLYIIILNISFLKSALNGVSSYAPTGFYILWTASYLALGYVLFELNKNHQQKEILISHILLSIPIYICINIVFYLLGVDIFHEEASARYGPAQMLSYLGINFHRTSLPFCEGVNGAGVVCGLAMLISFCFYSLSKKDLKSYIHLLMMIFSFCGLLLTDSRGGALYFTATAMIFIFYPAIHIYKVRWLPIISPLFIFIIVMFVSEFADFFIDQSRAGYSLAGRSYLWELSFEHLSVFRLENLIGYGYKGHEMPNLFWHFFLFLKKDPSFMTCHNYILQNIIDNGYLGLICLLLTLFFSMKYLLKNFFDSSVNKILLFVYIYLIFAGTFEVAINFYNRIFFNVFLLVTWYSLSLTTPLTTKNQKNYRRSLLF